MAEIEKGQTRDALREGLFVRALGRPCSANPYPPGSDDHGLWEKGWRLIDSPAESSSPMDPSPRNRLVPEFTPGAAPAPPRQDKTKPTKPRAFRVFRPTEALRILAVVVLLAVMLIALRWEDAVALFMALR